MNSFAFNTERHLVTLTGRKARNLAELARHLREVAGSSIYYHTHHQFLLHQFEKPEFHNDFATWASRALLEERLAERLIAIDLFSFCSIHQLREALVDTVESYMSEISGRMRECMPGDELYFCQTKSFVMPTGIVAGDVAEFFRQIPRISIRSLYYHLFAARLRLERPTNDFSEWLNCCGAHKLADAVARLNPYTKTLEELRNDIIMLGQTEGLDYGYHVA